MPFNISVNPLVAYLDNEHDDKHEDEGRVEVGDVERGAESADQGVAADDDCEEHGGQLGAEVFDQRVEDGGSGDGEWHHDDEVGEEGEAAEDEVRAAAEAGLDHLRKQAQVLYATIKKRKLGFFNCQWIAEYAWFAAKRNSLDRTYVFVYVIPFPRRCSEMYYTWTTVQGCPKKCPVGYMNLPQAKWQVHTT